MYSILVPLSGAHCAQEKEYLLLNPCSKKMGTGYPEFNTMNIS